MFDIIDSDGTIHAMQPDFEFSSWKVPARDLNKVSGSLYQAYDRNVFALHQLKRSSFLVSVGEDDAENLDPVIKISSFFFFFYFPFSPLSIIHTLFVLLPFILLLAWAQSKR